MLALDASFAPVLDITPVSIKHEAFDQLVVEGRPKTPA
jgi:hypothetical protein